MKTTLAKADIERKWYVVDAKGQTLGRLAVKIANLLRGRGKPIYTPHVDTGDYVIVLNAGEVKLTGNKRDQKEYMFYSGYVGGEKHVPYERMVEKHPEFPLKHAVKRMLPRNKLGNAMMTKLRLFPGSEHTHEAQNPEAIEL